MRQFGQRKKDDVVCIVAILDPRLDQQMRMVGHHTHRKEIVPLVVKMQNGTQHDVAGFR